MSIGLLAFLAFIPILIALILMAGLRWPSNKESAGMLRSMPRSWSCARSSVCFIPRASRSCVTRAPIRFRVPSSNFRVRMHRPSILFKL